MVSLNVYFLKLTGLNDLAYKFWNLMTKQLKSLDYDCLVVD